ncbi:hypothetical protein Hbl1158_15270 (plasmid) [Halobaculum sp. CBA1158]|uniref:PaaD-like zinc ribbon domain-containing protein n=1 Tax=Halobaculum sp. CBA1158 TaxID=2904243 RepID=UPI001F2B6EDC|nr:hypothetical protein [Halobaculum sp. CBA1158]UIP01495.1 hypothetical protein Hbl1158_15270 [Halobaculum sp. CBA1158]
MTRVAPDGGEDADASEDGPACPFCDSTDVVRDSGFGPEISKEQYYCNSCETPFERIKFGESKRPETGR